MVMFMPIISEFIGSEFQTTCLATGLLLSLVLPLTASLQAPPSLGDPQPWMRTVWTGQGLMALGGVLMIVLPQQPGWGLACVVALCIFFVSRLRRQLKATIA